jgi:hypothetical protein
MVKRELGVGQTFAKVFSKVAVGSQKAESRRKLRAGLEPRATVLYGREKNCVSRLKKVQFLEKSRAARARKPGPHLKNQFFFQNNAENEDPAKMTHSIPDLLSRDGVCARNFRESFAKVAVLLCERTKGKLR